MKNIKVTDQLPGITLISASDTIAELKPTESAYVEYSYIVKKSNVATHNVINVATSKKVYTNI